MEWADVARLYKYWSESPPVHEIAALLAGVKPAPKAADKADRPDVGVTFRELESALARGTPVREVVR